MIGRYEASVERVGKDSVDEGQLGAYTDLSTEAKEVFDRARQQGTYSWESDSVVPDSSGAVGDAVYVVLDERYYETRIEVGDIPVWRVSTARSSE
jgi:hypothetical protein